MLYVYRLITAGMYRRDAECNYLSAADGSPAIRLCATWWDAQETVTGEIKKLFSVSLIISMTSQNFFSHCIQI